MLFTTYFRTAVMNTEERYMQRCLQLAQLGLGEVGSIRWWEA